MLPGINDRSIIGHDSAWRQAGLLDMTGPKDMHDAFAFCEQVIGNDAAVAPPPDGFRAHDCAAMPAAELSQLRQAFGERLGQRIVGVVAKTTYAPIAIGGRFRTTRPAPQAAKRSDMLIADPPRRQRSWKAFAVELRIGARTRHRAHIDDEIDTRLQKQFAELDDRARGMAYGEEAVRFDSNLGAQGDRPPRCGS